LIAGLFSHFINLTKSGIVSILFANAGHPAAEAAVITSPSLLKSPLSEGRQILSHAASRSPLNLVFVFNLHGGKTPAHPVPEHRPIARPMQSCRVGQGYAFYR
jgi:hypothetical protein